mmetsp:Transcript_19265/g.60279  ORF Transcript_19265/g.60279 Transcript_19265/m.60279 type:complete len:227 (+) Transcript_19265:138-818(+)
MVRIADSAMGKKFPKRFTKPKPSRHMPSSGRLNSTTSATPPKKHATPRTPQSRAFLWKKRVVRDTPIVSTRPDRKSMFPSDSIMRSKKNMTPSTMNRHPRPRSAVPILALSFMMRRQRARRVRRGRRRGWTGAWRDRGRSACAVSRHRGLPPTRRFNQAASRRKYCGWRSRLTGLNARAAPRTTSIAGRAKSSRLRAGTISEHSQRTEFTRRAPREPAKSPRPRTL